MAESAEASNIAQTEQWLNRIDFYMHKAAHAIMSELAATPNHTERVAFAKTVLDGSAPLNQYAMSVATNSTVMTALTQTGPTSGVTDGDLEFTVNSMVDAFSGVATV